MMPTCELGSNRGICVPKSTRPAPKRPTMSSTRPAIVEEPSQCRFGHARIVGYSIRLDCAPTCPKTTWSFGNAGRVHVGYLLASGDDGSDPTETSAWMPLFEDPHANNRLGNLDLFASFGGFGGMTNIADLSLGYNWWGGERHHALVAIHSFTRPETLGGLSDDIGMELDLEYDYAYARNSKLQIGVSTLFAGDAIKEITGGEDDNITRIWAQVHLNWGK